MSSIEWCLERDVIWGWASMYDDHDLTLLEQDFWISRGVLKDIWNTAWDQLVSPWAAFGIAAARALVKVPPWYQIQRGIVGDHAAVNMFVAIVGESGDGKGIAAGLGARLVPDVMVTTPSSGEGLARELHRSEDADANSWIGVLADYREVSELSAVAGRAGSNSTILARLCKARSGEDLSTKTSDRRKTYTVPAHSYRIGLTVGMQPQKADRFFAEDGGGLPQRFLFFDAVDDRVDYAPEESSAVPRRLALPDFCSTGSVIPITYPDHVRMLVRDNRRERLRSKKARGQDGLLDGHLMMTRLITAYALAVLDGRDTAVTSEDWELSGIVIEVSNWTRRQVQADMARYAEETNRRVGQERGVQQDAARAVAHEKALARADQQRERGVNFIMSANGLGRTNREMARHLSLRNYEVEKLYLDDDRVRFDVGAQRWVVAS
ncbi:hypothetical protein [Mycolicibacterium thermoresistibile]